MQAAGRRRRNLTLADVREDILEMHEVLHAKSVILESVITGLKGAIRTYSRNQDAVKNHKSIEHSKLRMLMRHLRHYIGNYRTTMNYIGNTTTYMALVDTYSEERSHVHLLQTVSDRAGNPKELDNLMKTAEKHILQLENNFLGVSELSTRMGQERNPLDEIAAGVDDENFDTEFREIMSDAPPATPSSMPTPFPLISRKQSRDAVYF